MARSRPVSSAKRAKVAKQGRGSTVSKYDAAYTAKKDFVARPNAFLKRCLDRIAPKPNANARRRPRALDIGLGQGRNAMLLAQRGYAVTAIDRSEVGTLAAQRMAAKRGLHIDAVIADSERFDYGRNRWDLIVLLYYPQPMILIERLKIAVRPGGFIVVERFSSPRSSNPLDKRDVRGPSPMLESFLDWRVLHYQHDEFESDWHWDGESPRGPIVRLLARKRWRKARRTRS